MKTSGMLFWLMIACLAIFYVVKGNDMHKDRLNVLKTTPKDINISNDSVK